MAFISSTTLLVTFAFIFLQSPNTVSSNGPPPTEKSVLPPKALELCKETKTAVCPKGSGDKEPVCEGYAAKAGGTDSRCDADNGCSLISKSMAKTNWCTYLTKKRFLMQWKIRLLTRNVMRIN
uniref:Uncharacterized protein n=1 Tax=Cacopsylla melanoneura TaxID=428564 RepID=A0A8D8WAE6_9HEMI